MKGKATLSFLFACIVWVCGEIQAADENNETLQSMINRSSPNDTIILEGQTYEESLYINKPLTLIGQKDTIIQNHDSERPLIHIEGDNVHIKNITVDANNYEGESAILVEGEHHLLDTIMVTASNRGISFQHAHHSKVMNSTITRKGANAFASSMADRIGNGIDVYQSHHNEFSNNRISNVNDGIYIESSENNEVTDNNISDSRYAYHLMFTSETLLQDNIASNNVTGAMVMGTEETIVMNNTFSHHHGHVHAQGILLYDVQHALVKGNNITENLFGMTVENTRDAYIAKNTFIGNYIGVQLQSAEDNTMKENDFIQQVVPARAMDAQDNEVTQNFWESHEGLDISGDGYSDLTYSGDPIFQAILQNRPAFQLFAESPGFEWMSQMFIVNQAKAFQDKKPALQPFYLQETPDQSEFTPLMYVAFVFLMSIAFIPFIIGGRKT